MKRTDRRKQQPEQAALGEEPFQRRKRVREKHDEDGKDGENVATGKGFGTMLSFASII